jgi:hypothetical protein
MSRRPVSTAIPAGQEKYYNDPENFLHGRSPLRNVQSAQDLVEEHRDDLIIINRSALFHVLVYNMGKKSSRMQDFWMGIDDALGKQIFAVDFMQPLSDSDMQLSLQKFTASDRDVMKTGLLNFFTLLNRIAERMMLDEGAVESVLLDSKIDGEQFLSFVSQHDQELFEVLRANYPLIINKFLPPISSSREPADDTLALEDKATVSETNLPPPPYIHPPQATISLAPPQATTSVTSEVSFEDRRGRLQHRLLVLQLMMIEIKKYVEPGTEIALNIKSDYDRYDRENILGDDEDLQMEQAEFDALQDRQLLEEMEEGVLRMFATLDTLLEEKAGLDKAMVYKAMTETMMLDDEEQEIPALEFLKQEDPELFSVLCENYPQVVASFLFPSGELPNQVSLEKGMGRLAVSNLAAVSTPPSPNPLTSDLRAPGPVLDIPKNGFTKT